MDVVRLSESVAAIRLTREPVNSLSSDLWRALHAALRQVESDSAYRAVLIESAVKRDVFTAGNDINELFAPRTNEKKFKAFWCASIECLTSLYTSRLVTVACIRGSSPAGGCIIALCCDHRIMYGDANAMIGLNEVALGIAVPPRWTALMARTIGQRKTEALAGAGELVSVNGALQCGLIDEVANAPDELRTRATAYVARRLRFPDAARVATKCSMRQEFADGWRSEIQAEADSAWSSLSASETVKNIGSYLARLSKSSKL